MTRLVLGSASTSRTRVLTAAGIRFDVVTSSVDEDAELAAAERVEGTFSPQKTSEFLAATKAAAVASDPAASNALVLGCDSVFELDGKSYGKPFVAEVAVERWKLMRGKTGVLHTGHTLIDNRFDSPTRGKTVSESSSSRVTFANPTDDQIERYVATGEPLGCAGGFTVDGQAAAFVAHLEGDHNAVIGVSVQILNRLLTELGVDITELWEPQTL